MLRSFRISVAKIAIILCAWWYVCRSASAMTVISPRKIICGTLDLTVCKDANNTTEVNRSSSCGSFRRVLYDYWTKNGFHKGEHVNVTRLEVNDDCQVTLCDDKELMGYCAQIKASVKVVESGFGELLGSESLSMRCACSNDSTGRNQTKNDAELFDRNYVGVVYSPYDKYWEPKGLNGTLTRVSWSNYSEEELTHSLENISKKFTHISTYGMGTASNTSEWYEGDKIGLIPSLAAKLNAKYGYPAIRVSVGIFRKDDVSVVWKSKELYNAIEAAKVANKIFNGTVWGITVTSDYVSDVLKARDAIEMINEVKEINERENLRLKIGIRISKCSEFIANKRPEDDTNEPAYLDVTPPTYVPMTSFQKSLQGIAKISDYILCSYIPPPNYVQYSFPEMIKVMQAQFIQVREVLKKINPKLKVIIETGVPSHGIGNGFKNSVQNLWQYWNSMARFAQKEHIMLHMFEAVDQPWKNVQDSVGGSLRYDINGPNGADGFYGWWRRANNSQPPVYIEKVYDDVLNLTSEPAQFSEDIEGGQTNDNKNNHVEGSPTLVKILMLCFLGFVMMTMGSIGYLWMRLRKAKKQVISPAYVEQFISGGESCNTKDDNYAVALRIPYNRKYELPKENFYIDKAAVLGSGQSGVVFRGTINGRPEHVVFKCTTPSSTVVDIKSVMSEIKILSFIGEHDNILCLLGAYTKKIERGIVYVALEYCPLGSLESFLKKKVDPRVLDLSTISISESTVEYSMIGENGCLSSILNPGYVTTADILSDYNSGAQQPATIPTTSYASNYAVGGVMKGNIRFSHDTPKSSTNAHQIDITLLHKWAYQIASAMEFVAAKNVIHADLASRNVLLVSLEQIKVCDFGLSRKLYEEMGVLHDKDTPLPWRWMALESLKHLVFSVESDVWAYGVTVWEIFSLAEVPYHGFTYDMQFTKLLEKGMRLPQAKYASPDIHNELENCWDSVPSNRPSFTAMKNFFYEKITVHNDA